VLSFKSKSKNHFRAPAAFPVGVLLVVVAVVLVVVGGVFLTVFEPSPPVKHFEVPISNDRFAH
jgi:hypothetical protein